MFGCLVVYVADKIVLILRDDKRQTTVRLAATGEHQR